jgi:hypothetical protein
MQALRGPRLPISRPARLSVLAVGLALVVLWAPWLTPQYAERRALDDFALAWQGVVDGCAFDCAGCGVRSLQRLPTGYAVCLEYACGLQPHDSATSHLTAVLHVSVLGSVHGVPRP